MHFGPSQPLIYMPYMGIWQRNYVARALAYPESYHSFLDFPYLTSESSQSVWHDQREKKLWEPLDPRDKASLENKIDPLESFFAGKKNFLVKSAREILGLIYEREQLKYENLHRIDYDECHTKTRLFEIDHWHPEVNPGINRIRANIERELLACEHEKRMEEVACWRDVCRLKSDLREVVRELEREKNRENLISGVN
jgi:hypothetical protein